MSRAIGRRGCDRLPSRARGGLKLEAHERRETRQVSPAHHPICRSHSGFMFQSMWISRYVCKLLDGRGGDSESRETNLTIGFPVVFPPRSVAHVRATENPRPAVLGCILHLLLLTFKTSRNSPFALVLRLVCAGLLMPSRTMRK